MENFDAIIETAEQEQNPERLSTEEYAAMKKQEREELYAAIDETADKVLSDPGALKQYLDVQARLGKAMVNNALLAVAQRPDAKYLFTYDEWKERGRGLRQGEYENCVKQFRQDKEYIRDDGTTAMGYKVVRCYDASQTYGKPYKEKAILAMPVQAKVKALMTKTPVPIKLSDSVPKNVGAVYSVESNTIHVARGLDGDALFFSVSRELARAEGMENTFLCDCAANIACLRFGISPRYPDAIPERCSALDVRDKRNMLSDVRTASFGISGRVEQNLYDARRQQKNMDQAR